MIQSSNKHKQAADRLIHDKHQLRSRHGRPCPICEHTDGWCIHDEGAALCPRSDGSGAVKSYGHYGHLHIIGAGTYLPPISLRPSRPKPKAVVDWTADAARFAGLALQDGAEALDRLAGKLGVPAWAATRAGIGYGKCAGKRGWTFPERSADGKVIGINRRLERPSNGRSKMHAPGGSLGLGYVPEDWIGEGATIFAPEGGSDLLACIAMGLRAYSRPSTNAVKEAQAAFLRDVSPNVRIIIIAERDRKPDGRWPGREGAVDTAEYLAEALDRPIFWALPPDGAKDTRQWFQSHSQGIDLDDRQSLAKLGERYRVELLETAVEVWPSNWGPEVLNPHPTNGEGTRPEADDLPPAQPPPVATICPTFSIGGSYKEKVGHHSPSDQAETVTGEDFGPPPVLPQFNAYACSKTSGGVFVDRKPTEGREGGVRLGAFACKGHDMSCPSCRATYVSRWTQWLTWKLPQYGQLYEFFVTRSVWSTQYKAIRRASKEAVHVAVETDPGRLHVLTSVRIPGAVPVPADNLVRTITEMVGGVRPVSRPILKSNALNIVEARRVEMVMEEERDMDGAVVSVARKPRWEMVARIKRTSVSALREALEAEGLPYTVDDSARGHASVFLDSPRPAGMAEDDLDTLCQRLAERAELAPRRNTEGGSRQRAGAGAGAETAAEWEGEW